MKQLTYGMVGGDLKAFIGGVHRRAIGMDPRIKLVCGCFSIDNELNIECAEYHNVDKSRTYLSVEDMLEKEGNREDKIDFVSICTPNFLHYSMAKAFLEKGINVVCEKPLCFKIEEAEELCRIAKEKNLIFAVAYVYTGYTMIKVIREMIANGDIGDIVAVSGEYVQDWLLDELSRPNDETNDGIWRTDPKYTGISNTIGDIGTHLENMIHYITGLNIKRVSATINRYGKTLEYNSNILVEYTNGVNGAYWVTQIAAGNLNGLKFRICGTKGSLEWEQHFPDYVKYSKKDEPVQTLIRGCGYLKEEAAGNSRIPSGHPEGFHIAFANIYRNVITTLLKRKNGETPDKNDLDFPNVYDGLNGVKFIHAVIESGDCDSKWVEIN